MGIKLKALQEERMGMLMVGRETCGVVGVEREQGGALLVWDTGWKISTVLWTCVGGSDGVSLREKVEKTYMQL